MKKLFFHFLTLTLFLTVTSCQQSNKSTPLTIAITKERSSEHRYTDWLAASGTEFNIIVLSSLSPQQITDTLKYCHAILFTGGADIDPNLYGKGYEIDRCGTIDEERDAYEKHAFEEAKQLQLPILGICRGLQLINILEGGTLFIDLPTDKGSIDIHRVGDEDWATHTVSIPAGSFINKTEADVEFPVASNHHQGIEILAPSLKAIAYSKDSLIEAIAYKNSNELPFLLAVQWHPEWVEYSDSLALEISRTFLEAALDFQKNSKLKP